nr:MAG TPA: Major capsid protein [Microviridae sp.]
MPMSFNPLLAERHTRSPKHNFYVESDIWEITPVAIAPVLPGETLSHLSLQSRVVTPTIKSRTVGWWLEYYTFYVRFRQLPSAANLVAMQVDPTVTLTPTAVSASTYYDGRGFNFVTECLQAVTQEWFRREGENWSSFTIRANRPAASINIDSLIDSMIDVTVLPSGGVIEGIAMNVDDLDRARLVTEYRRRLREMGSDGGTVDYEEVLASYGVSIQKAAERDRPELVRYLRDWTYPANTVEPTTGVPSTVASWGIADQADKPRKFDDFGFLFTVQCCRPKVYFSNQTGHGSSMLDRAQRWLPPNMDEAGIERSLAEFSTTQGPYGKTTGGLTNGYWLDVRDLFNYGDQYLDGLAANANSIALPTVAQAYRYATQAMADALKSTASTLIQADGNIAYKIKTRHVDAS